MHFQFLLLCIVLFTQCLHTNSIHVQSKTPNSPPPPLHTCPAAARIELTRTKSGGALTSLSSRQWKKEMDSIVQIVSLAGGSFSQVTARLRAESPVLAINLQTPSKQPYRPPSSHFFSCSDSRVSHPGLFTPGGDLGEFIITLASLEKAQETKNVVFQQQDVASMLSDYLSSMTDRSGKTMFYACTDDDALERLADAAFVADPLKPASHRELGRILELVAMPDNWGSTHVRRMMRDGDGYYVRTQLVKDVVTAFMKIHLDKRSPLKKLTMLHSLPGKIPGHTTPYVEIVRKLTNKCDQDQKVPMFECTSYPCGGLAPVINARDSFNHAATVVHRDDVNFYRAELSKWAFDQMRGDVPDNFGPASLLLGMINMGAVHADLTRKALYSESSRYVASFVRGIVEDDGGVVDVNETAGGESGESAVDSEDGDKNDSKVDVDKNGDSKVKQY